MSVNQVKAKVDELAEKYMAENGVVEGVDLEALRLKLIPKAKSLVKQEAHHADVKMLIDFVTKYATPEDDQAVLDAIKRITTKAKETRVVTVKNGKATPRGVIAELFNVIGDKTSESAVFEKFRMGRGEMKGAIKVSLMKSEPTDRKWIAFDLDSETYTLLSIGPDAPAGWKGYLPVTKA